MQVKNPVTMPGELTGAQPPRRDTDYSPQVPQHHVTSESLPDTGATSTCQNALADSGVLGELESLHFFPAVR